MAFLQNFLKIQRIDFRTEEKNMKSLQPKALSWIVLVIVALTGTTYVWAEDTTTVLSDFQIFQQHFDQNQGQHRLTLLVDPG